jgi:hypothetical protein
MRGTVKGFKISGMRAGLSRDLEFLVCARVCQGI